MDNFLFFIYFFGGLECVGHSFADVASRRATNLATHPLSSATHLPLTRWIIAHKINQNSLEVRKWFLKFLKHFLFWYTMFNYMTVSIKLFTDSKFFYIFIVKLFKGSKAAIVSLKTESRLWSWKRLRKPSITDSWQIDSGKSPPMAENIIEECFIRT